MTWEIFKDICHSEDGKNCLTGLAAATVAAILAPILIKSSSIMMLVEMGCCIVVTMQTQKFSGICTMAVAEHMTEEQKLEQYKKGYIRRDE